MKGGGRSSRLKTDDASKNLRCCFGTMSTPMCLTVMGGLVLLLINNVILLYIFVGGDNSHTASIQHQHQQQPNGGLLPPPRPRRQYEVHQRTTRKNRTSTQELRHERQKQAQLRSQSSSQQEETPQENKGHLLRNQKDQTAPNAKSVNNKDKPEEYHELTFGHKHPHNTEHVFLFDPPKDVHSSHLWRYRSNGLYYEGNDELYRDFHTQWTELRLRYGRDAVVPPEVKDHEQVIVKRLKTAGLDDWATLFENAYTYTLRETTFPLHDGTTYVITGDIPLQWIRDSCAQFHPYLPLLAKKKGAGGGSPVLRVWAEGLLRRQTLFLLLDPYATSFRLNLDFDFKKKLALTDWDYKSGRTIHVAMHNYELDNLCYYMRLSAELFDYGLTRALDDLWVTSMEQILELIEREQDHTKSNYRYPELPHDGKGTKVCDGNGLTWSGFRPSDDKCKYGYLIPANMFAVVSLRRVTPVLQALDQQALADKALKLASTIDEGIHKHGVVTHRTFGKLYAYEVDACGESNLMDDANIPSLLSIPYLKYTSPEHDPDGVILNNTRNFVLSPSNPHFHSGVDDSGNTNAGVGSPHTPGNRIWHMSLLVQALVVPDDDVLRTLLHTLQRTATNDLMHEAFTVTQPTSFTRQSFAWVNSLLGELVDTRLDDIIRVLTTKK